MNRWILVIVLVVLAVAAGTAVFWWYTRPLPRLTVTTWPGVYGRSQAIAMLHPYGEQKRVNVRIAEYDGGLDHLREEVSAHVYDWDVIDFELEDATAACHAGLLEPVDASSLPRGSDGTAAGDDFVKGAIGPCWVGSVVFSQIIAYPRDKLTGKPPETLADFFDLGKFPGPRALRRSSAKFNLEMALLADGVAPSQVYPLLSTDAGVSRALAKLATISGSIVWWTQPSEPIDMLVHGRAVLATALNGDAYDAQRNARDIGIVWDRQLYELDVFGVPRGDHRKQRAMDFIRFATGSVPLAHAAEWVPYGPARHSSLKLVGKNPEFGIPMRSYLPTANENFGTAFPIDDGWWLIHGASIDVQWQAWLNRLGATTGKSH
jgi:putative spermidine/putrescine transport system substrate-binding protein